MSCLKRDYFQKCNIVCKPNVIDRVFYLIKYLFFLTYNIIRRVSIEKEGNDVI